MKSAVILALCATTVLSTPLVERAYEFKLKYSTVTKTVDGADSDPTPYSGGYRERQGDWTAWRKISGQPDETTEEVQQEEQSSAPEEEQPAAVVPVQPQRSRPSSYQPQQSSEPQESTNNGGGSSRAPSSSGLGGYKGPILDAHNVHRANHSVPDIQWSDDLASIAAQIASSCVYAHDTKTGGGGYGQNIGAGTKPEDVNGMITNAMYNGEINFYPGYGGEPDMSNFSKWGHYSQIVWKSTTEVGCATQYCPGGLANTGSGISPYFTVCNYKPAGNFGGQYGANVLRPGGAATVSV